MANKLGIRKVFKTICPQVFLWSATIGLIYAIMASLQPYALDDIAFRKFFADFRADPSLYLFFEDTFAGIAHQFQFDSLRLSNAAASLFMLFPEAIPAVALGIALSLTLICGWKLSGRKTIAFGIFTAAYLLLEPWREYMLTKAFGFNYVVSSAIAMAVCVAVLKNNTRPVIAAACGFIAGMWHEGFSVATAGGIAALLLLFPPYRNSSTASWLSGLIAGIIVLALPPGTSYRGEGMFMPQKLIQLQYGVLTGSPFYLLAVLSALVLLCRNLRHNFLTPELALISGCAAAGWVVWRCFMTDYRTAWPMILFSSCGLGYIIGKTDLLSRRIGEIIGTSLLSITVLQLLLCIPYAIRLHNEYQLAFKSTEDGSSGHFLHRSTAATTPCHTLNRVNYDIYLLGGYPVWQCVPADLAEYSPEEATPLLSPNDARLFRGHIVVPAHYGAGSAWICSITAGRTFETVCLLTEFNNQHGTFCYAAPLNLYHLAGGKTITGFTLIRQDI